MDTDQILDRVCRALDIIIALGDKYGGLFPSLIHLETQEMLSSLPEPITGQRNGDRAHLGSNLIHDESTLLTLLGLAEGLDRPDYATAANRYLQRFAEHCTGTETGLFPWGEHAYWHLVEDRIANSYLLMEGDRDPKGPVTHDHLRQAPVWLWEKLYRYNPDCVSQFAQGLAWHWQEGEPVEYIRHAFITTKQAYGRIFTACDFPRHSGFYILDLAFAYQKTRNAETLTSLKAYLDYWWEKREPQGLLGLVSRTTGEDKHFRKNAPGQTLSLAVSLLESAVLLETCVPDLAVQMRERARVYTDGFFAAPHNLADGSYVLLSYRDSFKPFHLMPIWGSVYGLWPASYVALVCLCGYRLSPDLRLLEWAASVGEGYATEALPEAVQVPSMDAGLGLSLLADLYDITGEARWLKAGETLADTLLDTYLDHDLPRGASGVDWYESQMGPGFLLHGLARLALLARDPDNCPLNADYTAR